MNILQQVMAEMAVKTQCRRNKHRHSRMQQATSGYDLRADERTGVIQLPDRRTNKERELDALLPLYAEPHIPTGAEREDAAREAWDRLFS